MANQFGALELSAFGRMSGRAFGDYERAAGDVGTLFLAACEISMHPQSNRRQFNQLLKQYPKDAEPLWPALCRYLARQPDSTDKALLEELAWNPENRRGDLALALKYFVRGDVVLNDGTELTLDEMCDVLKLPHLPYLEELPEELSLDPKLTPRL